MPTDEQRYSALRTKLMEWFDATQRPLPWRATRHPYQTWVSEVMLQQTRVDQVLPYLERFMSRFPDVGTLAAADIDRVLEVWEGLGYYARARNLHASASIVAESGFPTTSAAWRELPGVGEYTAAAVASILHDEPIAAIDGNVNRVVARLFSISETYGTAAFRRLVRHNASALLDVDRPGDFNEAMMDLGATVCTPRTPACEACPLSATCQAFQTNMADAFPIRKPRKATPLIHEIVAIATRDGADVLLRRRPEDGLLGGLWELPGIPVDDSEPETALVKHVKAGSGVKLQLGNTVASVRHAYSHFRVSVTAYAARPVENSRRALLPDDWQWLPVGDLTTVGMPRAHRRLLDAYTPTQPL